MTECRDTEIGNLLHAYELYALSKEDKERFEVHLLKCDFCYGEAKAFEREAALYSSDDEARKLIEAAALESAPPDSLWQKLLRYLWPEAPFIFRPAFVYLLVIFMIVPAYLGLRTGDEDRIRQVQMISLMGDRSTGMETFKIARGGDGVINFLYSETVFGTSYHVVISREDGDVVFEDPDFIDFDEHGVGRLVIPLGSMEPATYHLAITDPRVEPTFNTQEYRFKIEE